MRGGAHLEGNAAARLMHVLLFQPGLWRGDKV